MKLLYTLLTITILFGSNSIHAMNDDTEKEKAREEEKARKEDYEKRLASAKKLQQWAREAKALKNRPSLIIEQPSDDDDEDPLVQYLNGKRDDLNTILQAADAKERESRK